VSLGKPQLKHRKSTGSFIKRCRRALLTSRAKARLKQSGELWAHLVESEQATTSYEYDVISTSTQSAVTKRVISNRSLPQIFVRYRVRFPKKVMFGYFVPP